MNLLLVSGSGNLSLLYLLALLSSFVYFSLLLVLIHACMNEVSKDERIGIFYTEIVAESVSTDIWITKRSPTRPSSC